MSLHDDLLHQAKLLASHEPRRPKQASLRRAVSAAYYALLHLLTSEACARMVTGADREALRAGLRRTFQHTAMRDVCQEITKPTHGRLSPFVGGVGVPVDLLAVAVAFIDLQEARHDADYDVLSTWTRADVIYLVEKADAAFTRWRSVRRSVAADVFLVALLAKIGMRR